MLAKKLKCPKCDRKFSMKAHLAHHLRLTHGEASKKKVGRRPREKRLKEQRRKEKWVVPKAARKESHQEARGSLRFWVRCRVIVSASCPSAIESAWSFPPSKKRSSYWAAESRKRRSQQRRSTHLPFLRQTPNPAERTKLAPPSPLGPDRCLRLLGDAVVLWN